MYVYTYQHNGCQETTCKHLFSLQPGGTWGGVSGENADLQALLLSVSPAPRLKFEITTERVKNFARTEFVREDKGFWQDSCWEIQVGEDDGGGRELSWLSKF